MNTVMSPDAVAAKQAPVQVPVGRVLYWSLRRELWENRYVYVAPLAVAVLILIGATIGLVHLPDKMRAASALTDMAKQHEAIELPYTTAALLLMFTTILIAIFYSLDALYGERRDRSILFWKSLPVSDATAVLAKASIPILVIPLLTFAITIVTQTIMLLLASARLAGTGLSVWPHLSFGEMTWMLFHHLVLGHGLWYAPIWGWLLLCSAWSKRAPYLWATLPLLAIWLVERITFNTTYFGHWLQYRFMGSPAAAPAKGAPMTLEALTPASALEVVTSAGFWLGLVLTAVLLALAVRLRRSRGPA